MEKEERERLIAKGEQTPIRSLLAEGRRHVLLGREHPDELKAAGWFPEETDSVEAQTVELDTQFSSRSASISQAQDATLNKTRCRQRAKAYIRTIKRSVPIVLRKHKVDGVTPTSFKSHGRIGNSAPVISQYLAQIRPHVSVLDEYLKPRFAGESALSILESVKADLDSGSATKATLYDALPAETARVYLLAGRLLDAIEEMNVAGQIAFDGDAAVSSKFNKDLILKAVKKAKSDTDEDEPSPSEQA